MVQLDMNGNVVERRIVEPYGRQLNAPAPEPTQKFFAGHRLDDDEGLYPAGARTYDAEAARFTSIDPVIADPSDPRTLHGYAYAGGDPVNHVDPTGEFAFFAILAVSATTVFEALPYAIEFAAIAAITKGRSIEVADAGSPSCNHP